MLGLGPAVEEALRRTPSVIFVDAREMPGAYGISGLYDAKDGRVAKVARKSTVTRHGDLVVKEHVPLGFGGLVRDKLAPYRHVAGWRNARRLLDLGVDTATPLAWLRTRLR